VDKTKSLGSVEFAIRGVLAHLAVRAVVCRVREGRACPVEKNVVPGILESSFTFPGGVGEVTPVSFVQNSKLSSPATDDPTVDAKLQEEHYYSSYQ